MTISDSEQIKLLKKAIAGDAKAFSALIEANYSVIYHTAFKWVGNQQDAEDIAQDVCIKLGQSIRSFRMDSQFTTWLYRIVVNTANDFQRKRKRHDEVDNIDDAPAGDEDVTVQIENNQLWQHVSRLPEKQSNAVLLVYASGLTHAETAVVMECKESTVSWYIHEAKKQLKALML